MPDPDVGVVDGADPGWRPLLTPPRLSPAAGKLQTAAGGRRRVARHSPVSVPAPDCKHSAASGLPLLQPP